MLVALVAVHAGLMLASWGLLLPLGVVLARFFKKEQGKIAGKPFWFAAHRAWCSCSLASR